MSMDFWTALAVGFFGVFFGFAAAAAFLRTLAFRRAIRAGVGGV